MHCCAWRGVACVCLHVQSEVLHLPLARALQRSPAPCSWSPICLPYLFTYLLVFPHRLKRDVSLFLKNRPPRQHPQPRLHWSSPSLIKYARVPLLGETPPRLAIRRRGFQPPHSQVLAVSPARPPEASFLVRLFS